MKKKSKLLLVITFSMFIISAILPNQLFADTKTNIEAFVTHFYQECLSREPDSSGLNGWVDGLITKTITGADVAYGFVFSDEFIQRNVSNEEYLTMLYRAFFDREPDSGGFNNWLSYLNTGKSRKWVLACFINSDEFKNLCADYEIKPGYLRCQDIEFTYIPPYGSFKNLKGRVWHVKPASCKVAVYIKVKSGWWTKPYWSTPLTIIQSNGSWTCDITTGGIDEQATEIVAFLLPNGYNPPSMSGGSTLPSELDKNALAKIITTRY